MISSHFSFSVLTNASAVVPSAQCLVMPTDLLNLRGSDIVYNPVFFSYCALQHESVHVFVNKQQLSGGVAQHFVDEGVSDQLQIHDYDHVWSFLKEQVSCGDTAGCAHFEKVVFLLKYFGLARGIC